jgi:phage/plasmid primase-like uncharacterized protein
VNDRSLGVRFDSRAPEGFYVHSFAGDDETECREHVKSLLENLNGKISGDYESLAHAEKAVDRITRAMMCWQEAKPAKGTIVETYLHGRGCGLDPILGADVIRFHPCCPFGGLQVPVMLALITDAITGEPIGLHRTAVDDCGTDKRYGKFSKKMLGVARGGVVRLHPPSAHLAIAEGVETALSAAQVFGVTVWATTSAGGIAAFPVLKGVKRLTVFADNDEPGMAAAATCCRRYNAAGIDAEIRHPSKPGTDWNDFVRQEQDECQ